MKYACALLLLAGCDRKQAVETKAPPAGSVRITWLGRAYVLVESPSRKVAFDPCAKGDYWKGDSREVKADLLIVSHAHDDHSALQLVSRSATIFSRGAAGIDTVAGIPIRKIPTFHDSAGGGERGENTVHVIELEGLRIAHLGDLGHVLTDAQVKAVGPVDILLLPVGGKWTIELDEARKVVEQLAPAVVIPMHAKTDRTPDLAHTVEEFAQGMPRVRRVESNSEVFSKSSLPKEREIVILRDR